jgi:hypothetical protein
MLIAFCEIFHEKDFPIPKKRLFYIVIGILFVLSFIRWERGTDWKSYYDYFISSQSLDFSQGKEVGWTLLNYCIRVLSDNYTVMLFVEAFILYFYLSKSITFISVYPLLSLAMYFALSKGGIFFIRQHIALAILMYSVKYIISREQLKFLLIVLLATMIHRTALFFLIVYVLFYCNIKWYHHIVICSLSIIFTFILKDYILQIMNTIGLSILEYKVARYMDMGDELYGAATTMERVLIRATIKKSFLILLYALFMREKLENDFLIRGIFNIYVFGVYLYIILNSFGKEFLRITSYFDIFDIFLYPYLIFSRRKLSQKLFLFLLVAIYSLIRLHGSIELWPDLFIPYKSIFSKELPVIVY